MNYLYVMLGGALGAALRYGVAQLCSEIRVLSLPVGTLVVNVLGCLLLGVLTGLGERHTALPASLLLMLTTGACGAFTTFSTFSSETVRACEAGQVVPALLYVIVSLSAGFFLFWAGRFVSSGC